MAITRRTKAPGSAQTKHSLAHRATIVRMREWGGNSLDAPVPSYVLDFTSLYGWAAIREQPELTGGHNLESSALWVETKVSAQRFRRKGSGMLEIWEETCPYSRFMFSWKLALEIEESAFLKNLSWESNGNSAGRNTEGRLLGFLDIPKGAGK